MYFLSVLRSHSDIDIVTAYQVYIKATEEKSAEMVTDEGAIYVTSNRGYNWKAAVQETVSATLNRYVALDTRCKLKFSLST